MENFASKTPSNANQTIKEMNDSEKENNKINLKTEIETKKNNKKRKNRQEKVEKNNSKMVIAPKNNKRRNNP